MTDRRRWSLLTGSVRMRVTAVAAVLVAVVLTVAGAALVITLHELQIRGVDDNLRQRADDLEVLVDAGGIISSTLPFSAETVSQIVDGDEVLAASHSSVADLAMVAAPARDEVMFNSDGIAVDDDLFRVLSRRIDDRLIVHVARAIDDVEEGRRVLIGVLSAVIPLLTLVLAFGVWVLVGRTLRPVESIRSVVAAMTGDDVHRRVPVPVGTDEITRLARTMNEMLGRVEEAQTRQRQFAADASHELRTPLARIRSELEVELVHPSGADPDATHRSVLEEVDILQRTIDGLLILARGEEERSPRMVPVDLDDIVLRETSALRERGDLTLDVSGVTAAQVSGDELQLSRAIRNLFDNAARHARNRVTVTLSEVGDAAVLRVADDGSGIAAADRERVFERFTRLDAARSRHDGGSGLGLPISRGVAERHGGTLHVDPEHTPGARFVVRLPLID